MNYLSKALLAVLVVTFATPGSLFAMENKTVKEKVNTVGSAATRELILQLVTQGTKKGFKVDKTAMGVTVLNNEILVDALENAVSNFFASQGKDTSTALVDGIEGFARGWLRSVATITIVRYLNKKLSDDVTKSNLYNGALFFIKGVSRFGVDSAVETAKQSVKEGKVGLHTVRVGFGYEFTAGS